MTAAATSRINRSNWPRARSINTSADNSGNRSMVLLLPPHPWGSLSHTSTTSGILPSASPFPESFVTPPGRGFRFFSPLASVLPRLGGGALPRPLVRAGGAATPPRSLRFRCATAARGLLATNTPASTNALHIRYSTLTPAQRTLANVRCSPAGMARLACPHPIGVGVAAALHARSRPHYDARSRPARELPTEHEP